MTDLDLPEIDCLELRTTRFYMLKKGDSIPLAIDAGRKIILYGLSMRNVSDAPVRLIGRKWVCRSADGDTDVTEGDSLFNSRPLLMPGEVFAFNGFHLVSPPAAISLTLIGRDDDGHIFRTPTYRLGRD